MALPFFSRAENPLRMTPNRRTFLKQLGFGAGGLGFAFTLPRAVYAHGSSAARLPRSAPEAEGVSSAGILAFLEAIAQSKHEFHSIMMLRHGRVIAEGWWSPYGPDLNHTLYSMSKSFTSTAVGLAVADGKLQVEDKVVSFFPKDLPDAVSENLAALRVRDLLTMSVGHDKEPSGTMVKEENWVKAFLAWPIPNAPGSHFLYNSAATYMLSAIVQQVTGKTALECLKPRLFEPLGIEGATWETCPRGINTGGWGLSVRTEDLAKFGQLYLQKGVWKGREILPAKWVEEATTFKIQQPAPAKPTRPDAQNDWLQGYCYQFWRCQHQAFRGDGAFGQFTIVFPEQDAVIAITSESPSMQGELDLVWEHLLPAMHADALPEDRSTQWRLAQTLSSLALMPPKGQTASPEAERISGKTFKLEESSSGIQSASFEFRDAACLFTLKDAHAEYPIRCGLEKWKLGETALPGTPPRIISGGAPKPGTPAKVAASATWKPDASDPARPNVLELTWRYYETPHHDTVTCRFEGDKVEIGFMSSVAQKSAKPKDPRPALRGQMPG